MQIIFPFSGTPEEYVAGAAHKEVLPPPVCPACERRGCFESLGYYTRGLNCAGSSGVMPIVIRRFRCIHCRISVSLLPNFAQPYRLVRNEVIQKFFDGESDDGDMQRWDYLLRRYMRRFCQWFPDLLVRTEIRSGRSPPGNFVGFWKLFTNSWGTLEAATNRLIRDFCITAFGAYRCHMLPRNPPHLPHTTRLFYPEKISE